MLTEEVSAREDRTAALIAAIDEEVEQLRGLGRAADQQVAAMQRQADNLVAELRSTDYQPPGTIHALRGEQLISNVKSLPQRR